MWGRTWLAVLGAPRAGWTRACLRTGILREGGSHGDRDRGARHRWKHPAGVKTTNAAAHRRRTIARGIAMTAPAFSYLRPIDGGKGRCGGPEHRQLEPDGPLAQARRRSPDRCMSETATRPIARVFRQLVAVPPGQSSARGLSATLDPSLGTRGFPAARLHRLAVGLYRVELPVEYRPGDIAGHVNDDIVGFLLTSREAAFQKTLPEPLHLAP